MGRWAKTQNQTVGFTSTTLEVVTSVIVADEDFINNYIDNEPGRWIETKKGMIGGILYDSDGTKSADQSGTLRYNYAGVGMIYDPVNDAFYAQQPYPSWVLNKTTYMWEPPITKPTDNQSRYYWREEKYQTAVKNSTDTSVAWEKVTPHQVF